MNLTTTLASAALLVSITACGSKTDGAAAGASATPGTTAAATANATATATAVSPAASFPAQPLPEPYATMTVGAPPGAKMEKGVTGDYATIETSDYTFKIQNAKDTDTAGLKEFLGKGGAKFLVDQPDGIVAEMPTKAGGKDYMVVRYLKIGDASYACETTMKGAAKTEEKAREVFAVCGTVAKK